MLNKSADYAFLFHHFIDQVSEYAIFTLDKNGFINSWNAGAERIKGYREKEILGQHLRICFPDEEVAAGKPEEELKLACELGQYKVQGWRKRKDGTFYWANIVLTAVFDVNRQLVGYTKITRELTEEKQAEDELRQKQEELLQVNQDLDNFIHIASHDLRAPIANIAGLIQGLQDMLQGQATAEISAYIQLLQVSINRFKQTIKELTAVGKLNQVTGDNNAEKIDIPALEQEVEDVLLEGMPGPFHFETDFQVRELYFSKSKFRSILYNLISNAMKYASPDRPCEIQVSTWRSGNYVVLSIRDNGSGIRQADQDHLFKMFKRFHPQVDGTGIGLYTIKRIIDAAGGKITFQSEENKGSEFKVYFKI
jgi:PAS domain S-box-containing protein